MGASLKFEAHFVGGFAPPLGTANLSGSRGSFALECGLTAVIA